MHFLQAVAKTSMMEFARELYNSPDQAKLLDFVKLLVDAIPESQILTVSTEAVFIRYPFCRPPQPLPQRRDAVPQIEDVSVEDVEEFYGSPLRGS